MRLRLLTPRYWLTWAALGLLRLVALLPFGAIVQVGRGLGIVLRHLPLSFVHIARRNLELCMPELPTQARERLLNEHFKSLGVALLEIPFAPSASRTCCASRAPSTCRRRSQEAGAPS
jgi:KDO2-lipid IV(A) lauroyltransferase